MAFAMRLSVGVLVLAISIQHSSCFAPTLSAFRHGLVVPHSAARESGVCLRMMADDGMPRLLGSRRLRKIKDMVANPDVLEEGQRKRSAAWGLLTKGVEAEDNAKLVDELSKLREKEAKLDKDLVQLEGEVEALEKQLDEIKRTADQKAAAAPVVEAKVEEEQEVEIVSGTVVEENVEDILEKARMELKEAEEAARADAEKAAQEQEALNDISKSATLKLDQIAKRATETLTREEEKDSQWEVSRSASKKLDEIAKKASATLSRKVEAK